MPAYDDRFRDIAKDYEAKLEKAPVNVYLDVTSTKDQPFLTGIQRIVNEIALKDTRVSPVFFDSKGTLFLFDASLQNLKNRKVNSNVSPKIQQARLKFVSKLARFWLTHSNSRSAYARNLFAKYSNLAKKFRNFLLGNYQLSPTYVKANISENFVILVAEVPTTHEQIDALEHISRNPFCQIKVLLHDLIPLQNFKLVQPDSNGVFIRYLQFVTSVNAVNCISGDVFSKYLSWRNISQISRKDQRIIVNSFPLKPDWISNALSIKSPKLGNLPKKYIFTVGSPNIRKNQIVLLQALEYLNSKGVDLHLVIAGSASYASDIRFKNIISKGGIASEKTIFYFDLSDGELIYLYQNATVFAFPSKAEGFGLPPIEAANFKIPVCVSNLSPTKYIGEQIGARLVDPDDYKDWAKAIMEILEDPIRNGSNLPNEPISWMDWLSKYISS